MGFTSLLGDFACWSTVVGLPHIASAQNIKWRLWWTLIFLILLGVFSYELYLMISSLLSYPSAVSTEILYDAQRFPAVTICNQNPYKKRVIYNGNYPNMTHMLDAYQNAISNSSGCVDPYGFCVVQGDDYLLQYKGTLWLSMLAANLPMAQLEPAMYTFDELIAQCHFNGKECGETNFTKLIDPIYGFCYSYNYEEIEMNATASRAGQKFGLKMIITPMETVRVAGSDKTASDYLPTSWLTGARVYVGDPGSYPQMFGAGMNLAVGYQTGMAIRPSKTVRAPPPCGECDDNNGKPNYYPDNTYSMETCFDTCRQIQTQQKCKCSNPRYKKIKQDEYCMDKDDVDCMISLQGDQANKTNPNVDLEASCGCTPPCTESNYGVTMSLAKFPSLYYDVSAGSIPSCNATGGSASEVSKICKEWVSENALQLIVYFDNLKYEKYTEDCSYTIQDLINDLGGHAGLWLGLSVISVVEVAGLLIILLLFCISGGSMKLRPSDTEYKWDERMRDLDEVDKELDEKDKHNESLRKRL